MRNVILGLVLLVVSLGSVQALSTTLASSYTQGETMLIEITGVIRAPISPSQIEFLRGHVQVGSFEYDIARLGERYFLYAIAPFAPHNYTLVLHAIQTTVNGQPVTIDWRGNFSISNQTAPYTLRPGFILTGQDFDIELTLNADTPEQITIGTVSNSTLTLNPGLTTKKIGIEQFDKGLHELSVGTYSFMVYSTYAAPQTNTTPPLPPRIIELAPGRFDHRFIRGEGPRTITFIIRNTAERDLSGFDFVYDEERFELEPSRLRRLNANQTAYFNLTLLDEQDVSEKLTISVNEETFDLPLEIFFEDKNATNVTSPRANSTGTNASRMLLCREYNGIVCLANQKCSGETVIASEGACCRGTCIVVEESSGLAWLGYVIGMVVVFILLIVGGRYFKARSTKKKENPLEGQVKKLERPF